MSNLSGFVKRLRDIMRNDAGINGDAQRIEQIAWMLFLKVYDAKEQDWEFDDEGYTSIIPEECRWQNWATDDKSGTALTGDQLLNFVNNTLFPTLKKLPVDASTPIKKAIVQTTFADANNYMKDGVLLRQVINVIDELDLSDYEESHAFGDIYESILKELQSAGSAGEFYTPRAVTDFMAQMIQPKIGETMADFACGTGGFIVSWLKELQKQVHSTADAKKYGDSIFGIEKKQFPYMLCITNLLLHGLDIPRVFHDNSLLKDVLDYTVADQFDVILMNPPYGGSEKAEVKYHFPADLASSETADLFMSVIMYRLKQNGRCAVILPDGFLFGTDNAKVNIKKKLLSEFNLHTVIRMPGSVFAPYTSITTNILFFDRTSSTEETWFYRMDMPEGYKHFSKTKPMKLEHFAPVIEWWNNRQELTVEGFDKAKRFTIEELTEELGYNLDQCGYPHVEEEILPPMDLIHRYQEERASLNAEIDRVLETVKDGLSSSITISSSGDSQGALGRLAQLTAGFPVKLQNSVLQMAIQGQLVEQRPEEGTGEELYQQILEERRRLVKEGKIKKEKPLSEIAEDEVPFEIPESWKWVRLGDIAFINGGFAFKSTNYTADGVRVIRISDFNEQGFVNSKIVRYPYDESLKQYVLNEKDILLCMTGGTVGKSLFVTHLDEKMVVNQRVATIKVEMVLPEYVYQVILAPITQKVIQHSKNSTNDNISMDTIKDFLIPLPPYEEQKRIVARLEELLPLCERLK